MTLTLFLSQKAAKASEQHLSPSRPTPTTSKPAAKSGAASTATPAPTPSSGTTTSAAPATASGSGSGSKKPAVRVVAMPQEDDVEEDGTNIFDIGLFFSSSKNLCIFILKCCLLTRLVFFSPGPEKAYLVCSKVPEKADDWQRVRDQTQTSVAEPADIPVSRAVETFYCYCS